MTLSNDKNKCSNCWVEILPLKIFDILPLKFFMQPIQCKVGIQCRYIEQW